MKKLFLFLLMAMTMMSGLWARERVVYTVNDAWEFSRTAADAAADGDWETVNIPHTWNAGDGDDEVPGMYRGQAWYRKSVTVPIEFSDRRALFYFEGANQEVELYVNGSHVGSHIGGYTRFCFDITPYLKFGEKNLFAVSVNNRYNPDIPPLSADFTFYGGIYRDIYLKFISPVHVATNDYASSGVYIRTPEVSEESASVEVTVLLSNDSGVRADVVVENLICDADGNAVKSEKTAMKIAAGETREYVSKKMTVDSPCLWDIDNPYLYRLYTRVFDRKSGKLLDEVAETFGLRWFSFSADEGFFLNGKHRKLIGTCRHQDFYKKGNALRDEFHIQDIMLIKKMGGNFLRVSHYPQDPVVMEMCDKLGIVTSVEIPVVNAVTESQAFLDNAVNMAVEMVRQDFNRPSVMIWGYMNEILLRQPYSTDGELAEYYLAVEKVARALEDRIRKEDPSRYTMMAYHNAPERYEKAHLTEIPMIMGWNLYQGWYEPDINEFQRLLDRAHEVYKGKVLIVTEYGPGVDPRLHTTAPERFDFSQDYGLIYHNHYVREMAKRPFIAGSSLWNLNDFYSESRVDAVPHVNNKGIVGLDREIKDTYLLYCALLSAKPYLAVGQREWKARGGAEISGGACLQSVPVFTNASEVELFLNGESLGRKPVESAHVIFEVPFRDGRNVLEASAVICGAEVRDRLEVDFQLVPACLEDFTRMNVMLGSPRYFDDRESNTAWIPEQEYRPGSWGYIGGEPYRRATSFGSMLGSEIDILGTDMNPVFQTQRVGIEAFRADVPDGEYSVCLYFAELDKAKTGEALVYNLGADAVQTDVQTRIFDVAINGTDVLPGFNIADEYGAGRAVIRKFHVNVTGGRGLTVSFRARQGQPVLNAISIYRNY